MPVYNRFTLPIITVKDDILIVKLPMDKKVMRHSKEGIFLDCKWKIYTCRILEEEEE